MLALLVAPTAAVCAECPAVTQTLLVDDFPTLVPSLRPSICGSGGALLWAFVRTVPNWHCFRA